MLYHSTRNNKLTASASEAILKGIATDGGLYVPESIPTLKKSFTQLAKHCRSRLYPSYKQVIHKLPVFIHRFAHTPEPVDFTGFVNLRSPQRQMYLALRAVENCPMLTNQHRAVF